MKNPNRNKWGILIVLSLAMFILAIDIQSALEGNPFIPACRDP